MRQVVGIAAVPLARAGLGLLMWSGVTAALLQLRPDAASTMLQLQLAGVLLGGALLLAGMALQRFAPATASVSPHGRGARLLVWSTLGIAALLGLGLTATSARSAPLLATTGLALLLAAFAAVAALASARTRPPAPAAWQQPLVLPVHLLLAMSTGLALLYLLMDRLFLPGNDGRIMLATLAGLGACIGLCKGLYWRALDRRAAGTATRSRRARGLVVGLAAGAPLLGWLLAMPGSAPVSAVLPAVALALLAAAMLEHRLFLGEGAATCLAPADAS